MGGSLAPGQGNLAGVFITTVPGMFTRNGTSIYVPSIPF
jgi:hypothetical protein